MTDSADTPIPSSHEGGYLEIWRVAYPLIIMCASHTVMQFCDRKFLGMNSTEDVAAALPGGILSFTLFSFFMVTVNFTSALVSQHFGNKDREACVRVAWNGFYFSLLAALLVVAVLPWLGLAIINFAGHPEAIMSREKTYFISLIPSGAFVCMAAAFSSYFTGQGRTWVVAAVNICSCLLNIFLDYAMIFGNFGFPAMGIKGAGIATSIATASSLVIIFTIFIVQNQKLYPTRRHRRLNFSDIRKLLSFGTPAGIQCFLDVGAFTATSFLIGRISQEAMAITTIALSINMLSFLPLLGISDATAIVAGQYIGRSKHHVANLVAYRAWRMASLYMILAGSVFVIFPEWLIGQFAPRGIAPGEFANIVSGGRAILICAAVFNFFDATKFIFMGALRGAGDTRMLMIICVSCAWLLMVPGVVIMILWLKTDVVSVWIFLTGYLLVESVMVFRRFRSGKWRHIDLIKKAPQA